MLSIPLMRWLCAGAVMLVVGHVLTFVAEDQLGIARTLNFPRQFDLNGEGNLAAWFYSFLLLCCAALTLVLTLAARVKGVRLAGRWEALAVLFLLMAVDETAQLHDMATGPLRNGLGLDFGVLYFAWLVPALLALGVCFVYFAPLARSLPADIRTRFVGAVALYVGGAAGGEMLGGFTVAAGRTSPGYLATITLEESLDLAGALLFLSTLTALVRRVQPSIGVQVHGSGVSATLLLGPPTQAGKLPDLPAS
jgi:hypothetical protein